MKHPKFVHAWREYHYPMRKGLRARLKKENPHFPKINEDTFEKMEKIHQESSPTFFETYLEIALFAGACGVLIYFIVEVVI